MVDHEDPLAQRVGLLEVVGGEEDGDAVLLAGARIEQIDAHAQSTAFAIADSTRSPEKPDHIAESFRLWYAWLDGERGWASDPIARLRAGAYDFKDESPYAGMPHAARPMGE
ncbi:MAG TPA: hypothetical protein VHX88_09560 [Solirubrobacteraceae bacterium]|nr:hypothetical protein [Solirubrobacteraceae bacterium]